MKTKTNLPWAILVLSFSVCLFTSNASAQIAKIGLDTSYKSDYITPNGISYGDDIYRIDITASFKHDIVLGLTRIDSFGNGDSPYSEEYQVFLEKTWAPCSNEWYLTIGLRWEFLDGPWDLGIPYAEAGRHWKLSEQSLLTAYARAEYWWNPQGTTDDNGVIATAGLELLKKLSDRFSLRFGVSAVYDPGIQGGSPAWIGVGEGYVDWNATELTTVYTGGKYYSPHADAPSLLKTQKVFELGVRVDDFPKQLGRIFNRASGELSE